jgi:hypothetical protein
MLGFLCNTGYEGSHFVPTTAFCPLGTGRFDWEALDAHHGRVLGLRYLPEEKEEVLVVWDPITDEQWGLPFPPRQALGWAAAVVCARTATDACDHLDCHGGHFLVVFVGLDPFKMFVCTYLSDVNAWSEPISSEHPDPVNCDIVDVESHPALVGNALYFGIRFTNLNLKYNLESCEMSLIQLPSTYEWSYRRCYMLTTIEEGVLGLITVDYPKLCIWLMKDAPEVDAGWTQTRVIDLKTTVLPHDGLFTSPNMVGVTDGLGTLFMMVESVLYTIDLKTCVVELYQYQDIGIKYIVPYMSFYTPGTCLFT